MFDPRNGNCPPKLTVYETLHDTSRRQLSAYRGVSVLLLDYLMVTALLLVTDLQEWMLVPKFDSQISSTVGSTSTIATSDQWRKIMFGEPIYPKIARSPSYPSPPSPTTPRATDFSKPIAQAGTGPSENFKLELESFIDTHSDSEQESVSEGDDETNTFCPTVSSSSVADDSTQLSHTAFKANFYRPPSPIPEPAVPSRPLSSLPSSLDGLHPWSPSSRSTSFDTRPSLSPIPQLLSEDESESQCDSPVDNLLDGQIFPRSLPLLPLQQPSMTEERRYSVISSATLSTMINYPRPLPLPLERSPTVIHIAPQVSDLRRAASVSHSLTQPRPLRPLPPTPGSRTQPPSPQDNIIITPSGNPPQPLEGYSHSPSHLVCPSEGRPIRKTSHEDLAQWLHVLTTDSEARTGPPEPLPRTFDVPPPAYNSLRFSVISENVDRTAVPVWGSLPSN